MAKNVLITGGSRGIGKAIAERLNAEADFLKIYAPSSKELDQSFEASIESFKEKAELNNDPLYGLIVNAGIHHSEHFEDYSVKNWNRVIDVNLNGAFYIIKHFIENLKTQYR